jgi:hypothetical protein
MSLQHRQSDGHDEYATPTYIWRPLARAVGGFDVDPASGAESQPIAETRYTIEDNGLEQSWEGDVWLNPPFADKPSTGEGKREKWLKKARSEVQRPEVRTVTTLLPVDVSTNWFHEHVVEADVICFLDHRPEFEGNKAEASGNTSFAIQIAVYGDAPEALIEALEQFGAVFRGRKFFRQTVQETLVPATDGGNSRYVGPDNPQESNEADSHE